MRNKFAAGLVLLGWLGLLCVSGSAHAERTVIDMAGRTIRLPDQVRKVYAIGHCVPIVGAVAPDKLANAFRMNKEMKRFLAPSLVEGKAVPAGGMRFADEEIIRMAPDLIVMEDVGGSLDQAQRLEQRLHVPVVLIDQSLPRIKTAFAFLGDVLGRPEQGRALIDFVVRHIDPIGERAKAIPAEKRLRVYYAEGANGLATNPAGSMHTQVLEFVGGINVANVAAVPGEGFSEVSIEQLLVWQPDRILVWTPDAEHLTTWRAISDSPLWQELTAVKHGHVIQIPWLPLSWFDRPPGSNRLLGIPWLAQTLYPDVFDIDLVAVTREYFGKFYHIDLSVADAEYLLHPGRRAARPSPQ